MYEAEAFKYKTQSCPRPPFLVWPVRTAWLLPIGKKERVDPENTMESCYKSRHKSTDDMKMDAVFRGDKRMMKILILTYCYDHV